MCFSEGTALNPHMFLRRPSLQGVTTVKREFWVRCLLREWTGVYSSEKVLRTVCIRMRSLSPKQTSRSTIMTTIQLTLPDDLARKATEAGLLSAEAIQEMLREQLRRRAGETLREMWSLMPDEVLTPEIEQEVAEAVQAYRAEQRSRRVG